MKKDKSDAVFEELEQRLLFSADIDSQFLNADVENLYEQELDAHLLLEQYDNNASDTLVQFDRHELVIIDPSVENYNAFIEEITSQNTGDRTYEFFILDSNSSGVEQISSVLGQYQDLDAIHIISHGDENGVFIGNTDLNLNTVGEHTEKLINWQSSLAINADLMFYGCDVASTYEGQTFLRSMSALTGADVAASNDLTGPESLGGDWELEFNHGDIETKLIVSEEFKSSWEHTLALSTVKDEFNGASYAGNDGTELWISDWVELNDDGSATSGAVSIQSNTLELHNRDGGSLPSISRQADLSGANFATLTFDYTGYGEAALDTVLIKVSSDGGENFVLLESIDVVGDVSGSKSYALDSSIVLTNDVAIRFTIAAGFEDTIQEVHFDNVTITHDANNNAPIASNQVVVSSEDASYVFTADDFNFSDIDDDTLIQIQITSLESVGSLKLNGVDVTLNQVIAKTDIDAGLLTFTPVTNESGDSYDSFNFKVSDGVTFSDVSYSMSVDITPANDLPTAAGNTIEIDEDVTYVLSASDFNFSDIDGDTLSQIQITSLETAGSLKYNGAHVTLNQVITKADIDAGLLIFVPSPDENGVAYDSFDFKVHDGSSYSALSYSVSFDVNAVNDPLIGGPSTVTTNEDTAYTFVINDFQTNLLDALLINKIRITSLPGAGSLELNGVAVTLNQEIPIGNIGAGMLQFIPADNLNGDNYASFNFRVHNGLLYSLLPATMTVDVTPVNDLPTAGANTVVTNEDTSYVFAASDFNFADIDGDLLAQIQITTLPVAGSLELNGVAVGLNDVISKADLDAGLLQFVPAANANGVSYASFDFKVHDGSVYSVAAYNLSVDVTAVNDAPTAGANTVVTNEDTTYVFAASDFNFADIDGDLLAQIQITTLPVAGSLELNGVAVDLNDVISKADLDAGLLQFVPAANANGVSYASFDFKVHDGSAYSVAAYNLSMDVTAVNDAPTAGTDTVVTDENGAYQFATSDFNYSDIDGDLLTQIQITTMPVAGSLELDGVAVGLNEVISKADLDAGLLQFVPALGEFGASYANFDFKVHDGESYSLASYTMSVDVTEESEIIFGGFSTVVMNEDTTYTFAANDFYTNLLDILLLNNIKITSLPDSGSLEYNGVQVTINQVVSKADINAGLLKFTPDENLNGESYTSFNFKVHNGLIYSILPASMTIDVNPVNDLPTAAANTVVTNEDVPYVLAASDFNYSDIDGDLLVEIQITTLPVAGSLELNGIAVGLNDVISKADLDAGLLQFVPAANANGASYASFDFRVHDGSAYSIAAYNLSIDVTAVNDLPTASDNTVVTSEDTIYVFTANDFNYSDVEGDAFAQIQITTLPVVGSLELNGVAVGLNDVISKADLDAGLLQFVPAANANGASYASFDFRVHDGSAYSVAAYNLSIDVTAVNDLPTASDNTIATNEDVGYVFVAGDFNHIDIDGDLLSHIEITALPVAGNLEINGVAVGLNQVITKADIDSGLLEFVPEANAYGVSYASFDFKVHDGTSYSVAEYSITLDVTAVNDLPTAGDNTVSMNENSSYNFDISDFNFSDVDGDLITQIQITALPGAGRLELDGVSVILNQIISREDIDAGLLVFTPANNMSAMAYDTFSFKVQDDVAFSIASYEMTFDVIEVPILSQEIDDVPSYEDSTDQDDTTIDETGHENLDIELEQKGENLDSKVIDFHIGDNFNQESRNYYSGYGNQVFPLQNAGDGSFELFEGYVIDQDHDATNSQQELSDKLLKILYHSESTEAFYDSFDNFKNENDEMADYHANYIENIKIAGFTVLSFAASYTLRSGPLLASMLSSLPMWKSFDPIPVLERKNSKEKNNLKDDDSEDISGSQDGDDDLDEIF